MKIYVLLFISLIFNISSQAQESDNELSSIVESLKSKANKAEGAQRLFWLDSLSKTIAFKKEFKYDSILKVTIAHASSIDSINVAAYHLADRMSYNNNWLGRPEVGLEIFEKFYSLYKDNITTARAAGLLINLGDSYDFSGEKEKAITSYDSAIALASKVKDDRLKAIAMTYKGYVLSDLGSFAQASMNYQEASRVFELLNDTTRIIGLKNSLAILYSQNAFYEEATRERAEGIELAKKAKRYDQLVSFYFNAATDFRKQGDRENQIRNLKIGYDTADKTERLDVYAPTFLSSLAVAYAQMDSITVAQKYLSRMESGGSLYITGQNEENYIEALKHLAFAREKYSEALRYGKQHLDLENNGGHYEDIQNAEEFLAQTYEKLEIPERAYGHYKRYATLRDSINGIQNVKALTYYQTLYETEKRDNKIAEQEKGIALLDAQNELQRQWIWIGGIGLVTFFALILLTRSRNAARKRNARQEQFTQDLITAQEEERIRVARELHDGVGQKLTLLSRKTKGAGDPAMQDLATSTLEELRGVSRGLHPATLEQLGFTKAIETLINEVDESTSIFFTNDLDNVDDQLSPQESLQLYRIIQEVLSNMVKHSEAKAASIKIERKPREIRATIRDNGKGFVVDDNQHNVDSLGMKTLRERAKILKSKINIASKPQGGTAISLIIPV